MIHPTIRPPQATDNGHPWINFRLINNAGVIRLLIYQTHNRLQFFPVNTKLVAPRFLLTVREMDNKRLVGRCKQSAPEIFR